MSDQAKGTRRFVERTAPPRSGLGDGHVVAAGKGGVGTSTVALLLAFAARSYGPVVLVDARGGFGGPDRLLGVPEAPADSRDVLRTVLGPDLVLLHTVPAVPADHPGRRSALRRASRAEQGSTVIVDAGARPGTVVQALSDFGTRLVTVVGADGVSPAAAYGLAKLAWHARPETRVAALGNRVKESEATLLQESLRSAARRFTDRPIDWLGHLPDAPSLAAHEEAPWATLDQTEPDLMTAAGAVARRIIRGQPARAKSTLHLLK